MILKLFSRQFQKASISFSFANLGVLKRNSGWEPAVDVCDQVCFAARVETDLAELIDGNEDSIRNGLASDEVQV